MAIELIVICGPTAVGKSEVAFRVAQNLGTEIISVDSMQVYKGLRIGTAVPARDILTKIRHHMIGVIDPGERFSAADFRRSADNIIDDIRRRGKTPIAVGGSGLYIRALVDGLFLGPSSDAELRKRLGDLAEDKGEEHLFALLKEVDPASAEKLSQRDVRRVIRALEVFELTGTPISQWHRQPGQARAGTVVMIGLTRDRDILYRRIDKRVDEMLDNGLILEVQALLREGYLNALRFLRPLGYIELIDYLEGGVSLEDAKDMMKRNTRRYAKRQLTWFKKDSRIKWVEVDRDESVSSVVNRVMTILSARGS